MADTTPYCPDCGGTDVYPDTTAWWDRVDQEWKMSDDLYFFTCSDCGWESDRQPYYRDLTPGEIVEVEMERVRREKARA